MTNLELFEKQTVFTTGHGGTWYPVTVDGRRTAKAVCPKCFTIASLEDHAIEPGGRVEPSVLCDCGYHRNIFLAGWTP